MRNNGDFGYSGPMNYDVLVKLGYGKYFSWLIAENRDHWAIRCVLWLGGFCFIGGFITSFKASDSTLRSEHGIWFLCMAFLFILGLMLIFLGTDINKQRARARKEYLVLWALYCPESVDDAGKAMMDSDTNFILSFSHNNRAELIEAIRKRLNAKLATALYYHEFLASYRLLQEFENDFAGADFSDLRTKYDKTYQMAMLAAKPT